MPVGDAQEQPSADEVAPAVGVGLGPRQTEAGLAGEGDAAYLSTRRTAILHIVHGFRIAAVEGEILLVIVPPNAQIGSRCDYRESVISM